MFKSEGHWWECPPWPFHLTFPLASTTKSWAQPALPLCCRGVRGRAPERHARRATWKVAAPLLGFSAFKWGSRHRPWPAVVGAGECRLVPGTPEAPVKYQLSPGPTHHGFLHECFLIAPHKRTSPIPRFIFPHCLSPTEVLRYCACIYCLIVCLPARECKLSFHLLNPQNLWQCLFCRRCLVNIHRMS